MSLIALRELNIPHIEYHPILTHIAQMKQDISKLKNLFENSTHQDDEVKNFEEDEDEDED